jgi:hypothetical protein
MVVIPGRREAANPESIITIIAVNVPALVLCHLWLWIPGSELRSAPE